MVRRLSALLACVVVVALVAAPVPGVAAQAPVRLHGDGRWLVDAQGRTVLLHGVNVVYKEAPYIPGGGRRGFTEADADFLAANGFNAVRLGVLFAGVMPERGQIDQGYLDRVDRVVRLLAERRIWVLLDFHQDALDQWPEWAVPWNPLVPDDRIYPWPGDYFLSAKVNAAFENLWADTNGVWRHYREFAAAVAQRFAGRSYVLGYDLMNEPWPGAQWPVCFSLAGCAARDDAIQRFQENAAAGIRRHDRSGIVWFEPNILSLYWAPSHLGDRPVTDSRRGFTWHVYCGSSEFLRQAGPDCELQERQVLANGVRNGANLGAPLLLGEFGATDDAAHLRQVADLADEHLLGWLHWSYKAYPGQGPSSALFTDSTDFGTLKRDKADALIRPYPRAIAGTPHGFRFDPASGRFTLSYRPNGSRAATEIFVPRRHYPRGYRVAVTGGRANVDGSVVAVRANAGAARVDITLTRRGSSSR